MKTFLVSIFSDPPSHVSLSSPDQVNTFPGKTDSALAHMAKSLADCLTPQIWLHKYQLWGGFLVRFTYLDSRFYLVLYSVRFSWAPITRTFKNSSVTHSGVLKWLTSDSFTLECCSKERSWAPAHKNWLFLYISLRNLYRSFLELPHYPYTHRHSFGELISNDCCTKIRYNSTQP